jgi:P-type Cu2+ transporter
MDHGSHAAHPATHSTPVAPATSHDRHEGHSVAMFRDRFWLSLALSIPVVLLSDDVAMLLGY